jgi:hypothetical protein
MQMSHSSFVVRLWSLEDQQNYILIHKHTHFVSLRATSWLL